MAKFPLSPAEFDAACRRFEARYRVSQTSAIRTFERNRIRGGDIKSKHLLGMARDYVFDEGVPEKEKREAVLAYMSDINLWGMFHGEDDNYHLHIQGLPTGDVPTWWVEKYGNRGQI